jgi:hypothetical protein
LHVEACADFTFKNSELAHCEANVNLFYEQQGYQLVIPYLDGMSDSLSVISSQGSEISGQLVLTVIAKVRYWNPGIIT